MRQLPIQLGCSYKGGGSLPPTPYYSREGAAQERPGYALPHKLFGDCVYRVLGGGGRVGGGF